MITALSRTAELYAIAAYAVRIAVAVGIYIHIAIFAVRGWTIARIVRDLNLVSGDLAVIVQIAPTAAAKTESIRVRPNRITAAGAFALEPRTAVLIAIGFPAAALAVLRRGGGNVKRTFFIRITGGAGCADIITGRTDSDIVIRSFLDATETARETRRTFYLLLRGYA
jgi:hypothetical protein